MNRWLALCACSFLVAACGHKPPPPPDTTGDTAGSASGGDASAVDMPPASDIPSSTASTSAPPEPPAPAALTKPASKATIGGTSISTIDAAGVQAAAKKLGWDSPSAGGMGAGVYEDKPQVTLTKGKLSADVHIIRPAASPTASTSPIVAPKDQQSGLDPKKVASFYDETADVLVTVSIEGKFDEAKKLLGKLVKKK